MSLATKLMQRFTGGNEGGVDPGADAQKNMLTAAGNPSYMEVRRRGEGWTVQTTTLFAPLTAIPTTVAILEAYNNGSRLMVVSDLFAMHVLATAVVQTHAIYAGITTNKKSPALTALKVRSLSGREEKTPTIDSELVVGVGTTIISNGWRPWGGLQNFNLGAATPGESWSVPVDGKLTVPPGCSLVLHVAGALATASSFQMGFDFDWVSAKLDS
ncbi:MAG: hypothetical protein V3S68_03325 [Dehalococcoidia bacterium]